MPGSPTHGAKVLRASPPGTRSCLPTADSFLHYIITILGTWWWWGGEGGLLHTILLLTSLLGERLPASAFPEAIPLTVLASSVGPLEGRHLQTQEPGSGPGCSNLKST